MKHLFVAAFVCIFLSACGNPLHNAIYNNDAATVKALIDKGADVNIENRHCHTPLIAAILYDNDIDTIKTLIDKGANANLRARWHYYGVVTTPLIVAVSRSPEVARYLVEHGAYVNETDGDTNTALHYAKSLEIVKYLVEHGANINGKGSDDNTPLHYAAGDCDFPRISYLLEKGADTSIRNTSEGVTFFYYLAACNEGYEGYREQLPYLLSVGKNHLLKKSQYGSSFYTVAVARENLHAVAVMRKAGVTESYYQGRTPEQITGLPNFYNPAPGTYLIPEGNEDFYRLAVEDCNIYLTYRGKDGPFPMAFKSLTASARAKNFPQCMDAMGFKYMGEK